MERLTLQDVELYRNLGNKIESLAKDFYNKYIVNNTTYEYLGWELLDTNEIIINFSFIDYRGERSHDTYTLSISELNDDVIFII